MGYEFKGIKYDDIIIGSKIYTASRTVTETDIINFAGLSGDYNPLHTNVEYAKNEGPFGGIIAHGALTFVISTGLMNQVGPFEGTLIGFAGINLKFTAPVYPGDTLTCIMTPVSKRETSKPDKGLVVAQVDVINQNGVKVIDQEWTMVIKR